MKYTDTTLSANIANSGDTANIVPSLASLNFDIRTKSRENAENILTVIKNVLLYLERKYYGSKITLKRDLYIPPLEKNNNKFISKLINELNVAETEFTGGCEAGYYSQISDNTIIYGAGDLTHAHKPNECLNINTYEKYNINLIKLIENLNQNFEGEN